MAVQDLFPTVPTTTAQACEIFDAAEAVDPDSMLGTWHGFELPALKNHSFLGPINTLAPLLRTRSPRARLRTTRFRGVDSATMVYDQAPVNDVFRRLTDDAVIGAMDLRGSARPYFFVLCREDSLKLA